MNGVNIQMGKCMNVDYYECTLMDKWIWMDDITIWMLNTTS